MSKPIPVKTTGYPSLWQSPPFNAVAWILRTVSKPWVDGDRKTVVSVPPSPSVPVLPVPVSTREALVSRDLLKPPQPDEKISEALYPELLEKCYQDPTILERLNQTTFAGLLRQAIDKRDDKIFAKFIEVYRRRFSDFDAQFLMDRWCNFTSFSVSIYPAIETHAAARGVLNQLRILKNAGAKNSNEEFSFAVMKIVCFDPMLALELLKLCAAEPAWEISSQLKQDMLTAALREYPKPEHGNRDLISKLAKQEIYANINDFTWIIKFNAVDTLKEIRLQYGEEIFKARCRDGLQAKCEMAAMRNVPEALEDDKEAVAMLEALKSVGCAFGLAHLQKACENRAFRSLRWLRVAVSSSQKCQRD